MDFCPIFRCRALLDQASCAPSQRKALRCPAGGGTPARAAARARAVNGGRACKRFHLTTPSCVYRILAVDRHGEGGDNLIVPVLLECDCRVVFCGEMKRNTAVKLIFMLAV